MDVPACGLFPDDHLGELFHDLLEEGWLESVFQSIIQLSTGQILGWEAWVRGPRETSFRQAPALFSVAEETG